MGFYTEGDGAAWRVLPEWLTGDAMEFFSWPLRGLMGDERPCIPRPAEVPERPGPPAGKKVPMSRAFDYFSWLEKEKCDALAKILATKKSWRLKKRGQLLKIAAARLWKKLSDVQKKAIVKRMEEKGKTRDRAVDGRYFHALAEAEVEEVDALAVAAAAEMAVVDPVAEAEVAEVVEMRDTPCTPPRKTRGSKRQSREALVESLVQVVAETLITPVKTELAKALTNASHKDPQLCKALSKRGISFRKSTSKLGRPRGSTHISDEELWKKLVPLSEETSTMHRGTLVPRRTPQMSKRRIANMIPGVHKSQLCKRLQQCRLGISPASVQRGKCDACHSWRTGGRKQIATTFLEFENFVQYMVPTYFEKWALWTEENFVDSYELEPSDNPQYLKDYRKYVLDHQHTHADLRAHLDDEQQIAMATAEVTVTEKLQTFDEDVANMFWHLCMKRTIESHWTACWTSPNEGVQYMLWDHMVPA